MYTPPTDLYNKISPILQEELETENIDKLRKQLTSLEKLRYEVSSTRVEWHEKLLNERERLRMPKDAKFTEFDRKSISEASTSAIERDYEFLIAIEAIIKERLELGQVFMQTI